MFYIGSDGHLIATLTNAGSGQPSSHYTDSPDSVCGTGWNYMVLSGNSSKGQSLYLNGALVSTASQWPGAASGNNTYIGLGYLANWIVEWFQAVASRIEDSRGVASPGFQQASPSMHSPSGMHRA